MEHFISVREVGQKFDNMVYLENKKLPISSSLYLQTFHKILSHQGLSQVLSLGRARIIARVNLMRSRPLIEQSGVKSVSQDEGQLHS